MPGVGDPGGFAVGGGQACAAGVPRAAWGARPGRSRRDAGPARAAGGRPSARRGCGSGRLARRRAPGRRRGRWRVCAGPRRIRSTTRSTPANLVFDFRFLPGAAYRNRTDDLRITRGLLPRSHSLTCTDSTANRTGSPDCTGISQPPVPRPIPRPSRWPRLATAVSSPRHTLTWTQPGPLRTGPSWPHRSKVGPEEPN